MKRTAKKYNFETFDFRDVRISIYFACLKEYCQRKMFKMTKKNKDSEPLLKGSIRALSFIGQRRLYSKEL